MFTSTTPPQLSNILATGKFTGDHRWPPLDTGGHWHMLICVAGQCVTAPASGIHRTAARALAANFHWNPLQTTGTYRKPVDSVSYTCGTAITRMLSNRPLNKKLVNELKAIGDAMLLDTTVKKDSLLRSIQRHIKDNPNVADDPQFLPLYAHRTPPAATAKTSAGKAAEDESETSKPLQVATGANKTLLDHRYNLQPLDRFKKLAGGHEAKKVEFKPADGNVFRDVNPSDEDSTEGEVDLGNAATTPEPEKIHGTSQSPQKLSGVVQVNFFDENNHALALHQVVVDDFPIVISTANDGSRKVSALLSELLPAAIKNDSPIKERGGRMYRPNIRDDPGHHHIGKIEALLAGTSSALTPRSMNEYSLRASNDESYHCDLFWDAPPVAASGPEIERLVFTGQGSDIPLNIAANRAMNDPFHVDAAPGLLQSFKRFVHTQIQAAVPDIPDFEEPWASCTFAGKMLDRYLLQEDVFAFLKTNKGVRAKGYMVPRTRAIARPEQLAMDLAKIGASAARSYQGYNYYPSGHTVKLIIGDRGGGYVQRRVSLWTGRSNPDHTEFESRTKPSKPGAGNTEAITE
ncbi:hypothetical protein B0H19DRAFT_1083303 [Mycena capillaripes]|nr:hypothetical protein B0H19DRAFT_1083303 [Mycena capillaripes]